MDEKRLLKYDKAIKEIEGVYKISIRADLLKMRDPEEVYFTLRDFLKRARRDKKYFGARYAMDEERGRILWHTPPYQKDLSAIRRRLGIPKTYNAESVVYISTADLDLTDPHYFEKAGKIYTELRTKKLNARLDAATRRLLKKYGLEKNYFEWVRGHILNERVPHGYAFYNDKQLAELCRQHNWKKIPKTELTSGEKRFMKKIVRNSLGISNGRPTKSVMKIYDDFLKILSRAKNKRRRMRTLTDALETFRGVPYRELAQKNKKSGLIKEIDRLERTKVRARKKYIYLKVKK